MYNYPPPGYPPSPYGYGPPPSRKPLWPWVLGGLAVLVVIVIAIAVAVVVSTAGKPGRSVAMSYEVEGSARSVMINSSTADGDDLSENHVALPWSKKVTPNTDVLFVRVWVIADPPGGTLTCRIMQNGKKVAEETANGSMASVHCVGETGYQMQFHRTPKPKLGDR
jgi:hypothetical protein